MESRSNISNIHSHSIPKASTGSPTLNKISCQITQNKVSFLGSWLGVRPDILWWRFGEARKPCVSSHPTGSLRIKMFTLKSEWQSMLSDWTRMIWISLRFARRPKTRASSLIFDWNRSVFLLCGGKVCLLLLLFHVFLIPDTILYRKSV